MKYVKNGYGISVKKCCASCLFKRNGRLMTMRLCTKKRIAVEPGYVCRFWEMSDNLKFAGNAQGVVRDRKTKTIVF